MGAPMIPVVYWHSPPEAGPRELFVALLNYLRYQITRGTIGEVRERVYQILKACGVEMIIVDEAHRLRPKTLEEIRDIFDALEIAAVLVGTDRLDAVMRRDEQVYKRFMACYRFHRLSSEQLQQTTAIWEAYVLKLPEPSNLATEKMQVLLAKATGGYLGLLDRILRDAAILALESGQLKIDYTLLNQVTAEYR
jgi:DNA transposition AAA+ family ATPase